MYSMLTHFTKSQEVYLITPEGVQAAEKIYDMENQKTPKYMISRACVLLDVTDKNIRVLVGAVVAQTELQQMINFAKGRKLPIELKRCETLSALNHVDKIILEHNKGFDID